MVGTWMLWQNGWGLGGPYHGCTWMLWLSGWGLGGRYHGWDMDARTLWQNGWGLGGHYYYGRDMDAVAEQMEYGWTISWLGHGCSGRTDGAWVHVIMVGTWMLKRTDGVWDMCVSVRVC